VPLNIVQSDRQFTNAVEAARGRIQLTGQLVKGAILFQKAAQIWENVAELAGRELAGPYDPATVRLTLTAAAPPATVIKVLKPVTNGAAGSGWRVQPETGTVNCGYASPASVSDDVQYCWPNASAADVCWPEPGNASVLCLWHPWEKVLHRMAAVGIVPVTAPTKADPVGIELGDGTRCRLRNGGSWSGRAEDDSLAGFYNCGGDNGRGSGGLAVWARQGGSAFDTSSRSWTVRLGGSSGPLRTERVVTAYVVG
jgi:hypothetical protein